MRWCRRPLRLVPVRGIREQGRASMKWCGLHMGSPLAIASSFSLTAMRRLRDDSLLRNSIYLMVIPLVNSALGYAYWIVAARVMSPHDVGLGAALLSASMLAST